MPNYCNVTHVSFKLVAAFTEMGPGLGPVGAGVHPRRRGQLRPVAGAQRPEMPGKRASR